MGRGNQNHSIFIILLHEVWKDVSQNTFLKEEFHQLLTQIEAWASFERDSLFRFSVQLFPKKRPILRLQITRKHKLSQQVPYIRLLRSYPESCMAIRGNKKLKELVEINVHIASQQQNTTIIAWPILVFFPLTQNVNPFEFRNCRA